MPVFSNALSLHLLKHDGRTMRLSCLLFENVPRFNVEMFVSMSDTVLMLQDENAFSEIDSKELGKFMYFSDVQPWNADIPIDVRP